MIEIVNYVAAADRSGQIPQSKPLATLLVFRLTVAPLYWLFPVPVAAEVSRLSHFSMIAPV